MCCHSTVGQAQPSLAATLAGPKAIALCQDPLREARGVVCVVVDGRTGVHSLVVRALMQAE